MNEISAFSEPKMEKLLKKSPEVRMLLPRKWLFVVMDGLGANRLTVLADESINKSTIQ